VLLRQTCTERAMKMTAMMKTTMAICMAGLGVGW